MDPSDPIMLPERSRLVTLTAAVNELASIDSIDLFDRLIEVAVAGSQLQSWLRLEAERGMATPTAGAEQMSVRRIFRYICGFNMRRGTPAGLAWQTARSRM